nr:ComEC/Rec2 family competence protein [[Mycoplasma] anseris]
MESHELKETEIQGYFRIEKIMNNAVVLNYKGFNISVYSNNLNLKVNDIVTTNLKIIKIKNIGFFELSQKIFYKATYDELKYIEHFYSLNEKLLNNHGQYSKTFLSLLLFGNKDEYSKDLFNQMININVAHLFVISGIHLSFLYFLISKILKLLKINKHFLRIINFLLLFLYLIFLNFQISALRAFWFLLIFKMNKWYFKGKFNKFDILSFVCLFFLLIDPLWLFNISFLFSFSISFFVLINVDIFSNIKYEWKRNILIIFATFFIGLLHSLFLSKQISVLGCFYQILLTPIVIFSYLISPFFIYFKISSELYFNLLNSVLEILTKANVKINLPFKPNNYVLLLLSLYALLFLNEKNREINLHLSFFQKYLHQ